MILTRGKTSEINIDSFIQEKILSEKLGTIIIIVPTNRRLRNLKKKLIDYYSSKPLSIINIETLDTISTKLLINLQPFISQSEAASSILIEETVNEVELNYFSVYSRRIPFGTLERIRNVISEYKKHGITPEILEREAEKLEGGEKLKAQDIANIYRHYSEKCNPQNLPARP